MLISAKNSKVLDDKTEIEDRFYQDLQFGTAGLRGVLGAGTNRMNVYTVGRAADGFARYIEELGEEACQRGIAISYDSRRFSPEFAALTARIFVGHGIRVYLSDELRPVPMLSYAIRHYNCVGGVMITASHNPKQYNGFKAYGEDGGQLPPEAAGVVSRYMAAETDLTGLLSRVISQEEAEKSDLYVVIGEELDRDYTDMLLSLSISQDAVKRHHDLKIIYTPLHGSGNKPVRRVLKELGFTNVLVVPEQEKPDPDFSTVAVPNPEVRSALQLAIDLAEREGADLVIATDPDADRTGVCVRTSDGDYQILTGNQIGLLLMDYILGAKKASGTLPEKSFVVTTIVSSKLTRAIARYYNVELYEVLTGFKFIAEQIKERDEEGDMHFQFGFEESFGYLAGRDVRDKDAVVASMLIGEMAALAADANETLYDRLLKLNEVYGYAAEATVRSLAKERSDWRRLLRR